MLRFSFWPRLSFRHTAREMCLQRFTWPIKSKLQGSNGAEIGICGFELYVLAGLTSLLQLPH